MKCDMCGYESDNEDDFVMPNFPENAYPLWCLACWYGWRLMDKTTEELLELTE